VLALQSWPDKGSLQPTRPVASGRIYSAGRRTVGLDGAERKQTV